MLSPLFIDMDTNWREGGAPSHRGELSGYEARTVDYARAISPTSPT